MCKYLRQTEGVTLIESMIAIIIVTIGLFGLLSMQPSAWRQTAKTDYLGRAANVLSRELTAQEFRIMNPCNAVIALDQTQAVFSSGEATKQTGDVQFNVRTVIALVTGSSDSWRVRVNVNWPPLNATGITETLIVNRQEPFRTPGGCGP